MNGKVYEGNRISGKEIEMLIESGQHIIDVTLA